jgi:3-hydroxyisobutyrate dehydrogenase
MAKVAFVGLGVMGYPMAGHLKKKGHEVTVYNRTAARAQKWVEEFGGRCVPTPSEAAKGQEFVFSCVGNDADLRAVTTGVHGAFDNLEKGTIFIDHTTASADIARELHAAASARGSGFIDAPVSGGRAGAESGTLSVMCGGTPKAFDRAETIIRSYARACQLMGPAGASSPKWSIRSASPGSFRAWPKVFILPGALGLIQMLSLKSSARARRSPGKWTIATRP